MKTPSLTLSPPGPGRFRPRPRVIVSREIVGKSGGRELPEACRRGNGPAPAGRRGAGAGGARRGAPASGRHGVPAWPPGPRPCGTRRSKGAPGRRTGRTPGTASIRSNPSAGVQRSGAPHRRRTPAGGAGSSRRTGWGRPRRTCTDGAEPGPEPGTRRKTPRLRSGRARARPPVRPGSQTAPSRPSWAGVASGRPLEREGPRRPLPVARFQQEPEHGVNKGPGRFWAMAYATSTTGKRYYSQVGQT